jgi:hypothetical protein
MTRSRVQLAGAPFDVDSLVVSHPGKGHDRVLVEDDFVGVADGATPLGTDWPNAGDFAATALRCLAERARDQSLARDFWSAAILAAAARTGAVQPRASCSAAVVRGIDDDRLEVSVLGDCTALIEVRGRTVRLYDPTIQRLDHLVTAYEDEARAAVLLRHRRLMNSPGGYWIFATDPAAADHLHTARVARHELSALLLHSDGLSAALGPFQPDASINDIVAAFGFSRQPFVDDVAIVYMRPC